MTTTRVSSEDAFYLLLRWLVMAAILLMILFPFIYAISLSISPQTEVLTGTLDIIPKSIETDNYVTSFNDLSGTLWNSVKIASGTSILALVITIPGAYVFGRLDFPFKRTTFLLFIVALMFPYILLIIPIADLWHDLGLFNTVPGLWLAYQVFVTPYALWIMTDYFRNLPRNYEEAAQMYGCTQFSAFLRVILPLATPIIVAVGFLAFLTAWNDFLFANMLTIGTGPRPAIVRLFFTISPASGHVNWPIAMSKALIIGLPPTVLYMVSRRYISEAFVS